MGSHRKGRTAPPRASRGRLRDLLARATTRPWPIRQLHFAGGQFQNRAARAPSGVNLVGFARGNFGIGEHLRSTAASLAAANVPVAVINYATTLHSQNDTSLDDLLADSPRYCTNLFCLNNDRVLDLWEHRRSLFRNRYNIGYGFWELEDYPDAWLPAMNVLDEMWAPSRHVRELVDVKSAVPVLHMPLAVEPTDGTSIRRADLGIAEDVFLFSFVFDFSSTIERKNPLAVVAAFQRAFKASDTSVALLLKTKTNESVAYQTSGRSALAAAVAHDRRIVVVDDLLPRSELIGLLAAADAYVSLHRAEGFGLGMAEAMALGKPVVATAYSGNLDFMDASCAMLVDYTMQPVPHGGAFGLEGASLWAEADVEQAAQAMRRLVSDRELAAALGSRARERMQTLFSHRRIGDRMRRRLQLIGLLP